MDNNKMILRPNIDEIFKAQNLIQNEYEWQKWVDEIPYIDVPSHIMVKSIPPLNGAVVRYFFALKDNPNEHVSVYLDCYGMLGACDNPYWELFPDVEGDNFRCGINETDVLIKEIEKALNASR